MILANLNKTAIFRRPISVWVKEKWQNVRNPLEHPEFQKLSTLIRAKGAHYDAILLSVSNKGEFTSKLRIFDLNIGDLKPVINLFYPNPSSCLLFLCLVLLTNIIITLPTFKQQQYKPAIHC